MSLTFDISISFKVKEVTYIGYAKQVVISRKLWKSDTVTVEL